MAGLVSSIRIRKGLKVSLRLKVHPDVLACSRVMPTCSLKFQPLPIGSIACSLLISSTIEPLFFFYPQCYDFVPLKSVICQGAA